MGKLENYTKLLLEIKRIPDMCILLLTKILFQRKSGAKFTVASFVAMTLREALISIVRGSGDGGRSVSQVGEIINKHSLP